MAVIRACYKCPDRKPGCHPTCERYLAEKAEWDRIKEIEDLERPSREYYTERCARIKGKHAMTTMRINRFKNKN